MLPVVYLVSFGFEEVYKLEHAMMKFTSASDFLTPRRSGRSPLALQFHERRKPSSPKCPLDAPTFSSPSAMVAKPFSVMEKGLPISGLATTVRFLDLSPIA